MSVISDREQQASRPRDPAGRPVSGLRAFHEQRKRRGAHRGA